VRERYCRFAARPPVYDRDVKVGFRVRERASEVVETLREVLGARVRLFDAAFGCVHAHVRKDDWVSSARHASLPAPPAGRCALVQTINRRWSIQITGRDPFDQKADGLLTWAAKELGRELSGELALEPPPRRSARRARPQGGGGSSGPAELGIPVAWARRART
jgi:hypothetical protein